MRLLITIVFLFIACSAPIDYYGNTININEDRIYLSKIREHKIEKNNYTLIFIEQRGNHTNKSKKRRKKTLNRYIDLIMSIYGYTDKKIIEEKSRGVIEPRYYVTIKFN